MISRFPASRQPAARRRSEDLVFTVAVAPDPVTASMYERP